MRLVVEEKAVVGCLGPCCAVDFFRGAMAFRRAQVRRLHLLSWRQVLRPEGAALLPAVPGLAGGNDSVGRGERPVLLYGPACVR